MAASAGALLLFVPVASDAAASSVASPKPKGRDGRGFKMAEEEMVRAYSLTELLTMTRIELEDLVFANEQRLGMHPDGSEARAKLLYNLGLIRRELAWREASA